MNSESPETLKAKFMECEVFEGVFSDGTPLQRNYKARGWLLGITLAYVDRLEICELTAVGGSSSPH